MIIRLFILWHRACWSTFLFNCVEPSRCVGVCISRRYLSTQASHISRSLDFPVYLWRCAQHEIKASPKLWHLPGATEYSYQALPRDRSSRNFQHRQDQVLPGPQLLRVQTQRALQLPSQPCQFQLWRCAQPRVTFRMILRICLRSPIRSYILGISLAVTRSAVNHRPMNSQPTTPLCSLASACHICRREQALPDGGQILHECRKAKRRKSALNYMHSRGPA